MEEDLLNKLKKKYSSDEGEYLWSLTEYVFRTAERFLEYCDLEDQSDDVLCGYISTLTPEGLDRLKNDVKDVELDVSEV